MPPRSHSSSAKGTPSSPSKLSSANRKRKHSDGHSTEREGDNHPRPRLTSPQLLANNKRASEFASSLNNKRPCIGNDSELQSRYAAHGTAATPSTMYSFTSRPPVHGGSSDAIDLTSPSPPISPQTRHSINTALRQIPGRGGLNPHVGAKKLVVKNLKQSPGWDSRAYLEKVWGQLDAALAVIFKDSSGVLGNSFSKEDLYRGVENVCRQGGASTLFSRLESRCRTHVERDMRDLLVEKSGSTNVEALKSVLTNWATWKDQMNSIKTIFFFLDRSYLLSSSSKPTLGELTTMLFREIVFSNADLKPRIVDGTCDLVAAERTHQQTLDTELFKQAISMFHDLSVYQSSFEPRFLTITQDFVSAWSDQMANEKEVPEFVQSADGILSSEMARCESFDLDGSTRRELLVLLEDHLIQRREAYLTGDDALADLLDQHAITEITTLYKLLNRRRLGSKLRPAFQKWVDLTGTSIVFAKDSEDMIVQLLSLKRRLDFTWRNAFQRDVELGHGLRESFATFINKTKKGESTWGTDNTKVGEMIAKYVDQLLRGGIKAIPEVLTSRRASNVTQPIDSANPRRGANTAQSTHKSDSAVLGDTTLPDAADENGEVDVDEDEELNIQLDQVLDLFRFLEGKAVFEAFYKKDLARRLLMGRSASADAERSMLSRLKTECGSGFTQNLEQMFKDIELAREELQSYKSRLEERVGTDYKAKQLDLDVKILSSAAWPTYPDIPLRIPINVQRSIEDFELHYKAKHTGRKLDWKHALAHCQMRATFGPKANKELVVSSFQAVVLLLFNGLTESDHLTYQHILTETGLPENEVKRTLQSLACAKLKPLTKHPRGKDIEEKDTFTVNAGFDHPRYRVKINQVQLKETKEENKETHIRVAEDRNFECQAAIVRIMKSRKLISHPELVSEVIEATRRRGVMGVADIKKNIDRLIEKDYMEREDGNKYSYVA